jgi:DNA-binding NarL/FixJ family response regulator
MNSEISVLLVDDHALLRKTLRRELEGDPGFIVVGEAGNGAEAVRIARQLSPQVVVMDMAMPVMDGVQASKEILKHAPQTAVLILSIYASENDVRTAFAAGARGYLLKNAIGLDLGSAIRDVVHGKRVLRREQANHKLR